MIGVRKESGFWVAYAGTKAIATCKDFANAMEYACAAYDNYLNLPMGPSFNVTIERSF